MFRDPIVEEVRAIREQIAQECDFDFKKAGERSRQIIAEWKGKVVTAEELRKEQAEPPVEKASS